MDGRGQVVRLPFAVLAILATVVVALLGITLVVRADADRLPSGPPRDPPAAPPTASTFTVDPDRTVRFQEFSMTLAGAPYGCGDAQTPPQGFTAYQACSFAVHPNFDASGADWSAVTGVLLVGNGLIVPGDLPATTKAVFDTLVDQLYTAEDHPELNQVADAGVQLAVPADQVGSRLGNVAVRKKGLDTPYDRLAVVVVRLESGRHVAFFSDYPHDGGKAGVAAVTASLNTISVKR